jgi:hypothetical protein
MSMETRSNGKRYYIQSSRIGRRIRREYVGGGKVGELAEMADIADRLERKRQAEAIRESKLQIAILVEKLKEFESLADGIGECYFSKAIINTIEAIGENGMNKPENQLPTNCGIDLAAQIRKANTGDKQSLALLRRELVGDNAQTLIEMSGNLSSNLQQATLSTMIGDMQEGQIDHPEKAESDAGRTWLERYQGRSEHDRTEVISSSEPI